MRVLVVGAGPAGATAALLLARAGIDVTLIERERTSERVFRGEGLMPLGIEALLQMGLKEVLAAVPTRLVESWDIWIDGEKVFVIPEPREALGNWAVRVISQPALLDGIIEEADRCSSLTVRRGVRLQNLIRDERGRVVGAKLEAEAGPEAVPTDLVLGCDGRGSSVRTHAGLDLERSPEDYDVLWFRLPAPPALRGRCSFMIAVAAGRHPMVCYTSWDDRLQLGLILPKGGFRELHDKDWLQESLQSAPAWFAQHVLKHRDDVDGPLRLNVFVGRCPSWSVPGALLLGDAAHPMSPVRAQGINLAFRDAIVAANHLIPVLRHGAGPAAIDAASRAIQAERQAEIVRAQQLQRREAQGQGDARSGSWRFAVTKPLARLLGPHRWAQQAWLRRQRDLRHGSTKVALQVPERMS